VESPGRPNSIERARADRLLRTDHPRDLRPGDGDLSELEEVTFVFRTIQWENVKGGITFEDSWTQAGAAVTRPKAAAQKKR